MAYNPGVQDMRGQFIGQGIAQFGEGLARGLQQFAQNQAMSRTQAAKFQAFISQNPDVLKQFAPGPDGKTNPNVSPDVQKAVANFQKGKPSFTDAATLGAFVDTMSEMKKQEADNQLRAQQAALYAQQARASQQDITNQQQAQQALARAAQPQSPMGQAIQQGGNFQQVGGLSTQPQAPSMQDVWQRFAQSGAPITPEVERFLNAGLQAEARKASKSDKAEPQTVQLEGGYKAAFSPGTGAFSVLPETPEQVAAKEGAKEEAALTAKTASTDLADIADAAEVGRHSRATIDRIRQLYQEGAQTGFAQPTLTAMKSAMGRFIDVQGLANQQELEQKLSEMTLVARKQLMKGTGQVSDYETKLVDRAMANPTNTPQANLQILGVLKNVADRSVKLDELRNKLEDEGKTSTEIARILRRERANTPIGIEVLSDLPQGPAKPAKQAPEALQIKSIKLVK